jgi:5-bromo-4-chloroindolyl phosphate hydrolysis protein
MAERFGGEFSPEPGRTPADPARKPVKRGPFEGQTRTKAGGRVNFLFLAPLPLAIRAFFLPPAGLAMTLGAFGLLILAAWLTREGIIAQEAYEARKIARRPAIPRKIFASVLTGAGLALAAIAGGHVLSAVIFGVLGAVLHSFAFGLDPLKNKGFEGIDEFQTDRVARAVGEAEKYLVAMKDAVLRAKDREVEARVDGFAATARDMFRTVENDPRDLTAARKYLTVYLMGARDAAIKFADIYARSRDPHARADFVQLLDDLEANFTGKTETLLIEDKTDLNIEIDVLRERLAREGVLMNRDQS